MMADVALIDPENPDYKPLRRKRRERNPTHYLAFKSNKGWVLSSKKPEVVCVEKIGRGIWRGILCENGYRVAELTLRRRDLPFGFVPKEGFQGLIVQKEDGREVFRPFP
jgi:hypothetical protein